MKITAHLASMAYIREMVRVGVDYNLLTQKLQNNNGDNKLKWEWIKYLILLMKQQQPTCLRRHF